VDPIVLGPNQVHRFYRGGPTIAEFRGVRNEDDHAPEDWVGSATSVFGTEDVGRTVLPNGHTLADAVKSDPEGFLGPRHAERFGADPGLLVKLLDAGERLPVHCHPDRDFARRHLGCPWGKTEAWVIAGTRSAGASVHLGFRRDVDARTLRGWIDQQDASAMLESMHRFEVSPGDTVLVPAGVPHAVGEGVFLVELQEPTDFSVLLEWAGFDVDGSTKGHLGVGFDLALTCVDRSGWDEETLRRLRTGRPDSSPARSGVEVLFPPEADAFFRAERIRPKDSADAVPMPAGFSILVVTEGEGRLQWSAGGVVDVRRGSTVLVPYGTGGCTLVGAVAAVRCMPPDPDALDADAPRVR
jgi:mannose-6-phosphate isomerase